MENIHLSLWMTMTDEKGMIWCAKGADDCGIQLIYLFIRE